MTSAGVVDDAANTPEVLLPNMSNYDMDSLSLIRDKLTSGRACKKEIDIAETALFILEHLLEFGIGREVNAGERNISQEAR